MPDRLKVLIYGKSLFLDGIEAGFKDCAGMEIRRAGEQGDVQEMDVVLLDMDRLPSGVPASFFTGSSGPVVIGLSTKGNTAVLLSGEPRTMGTVGDLREFIAEQVGRREGRGR